MFCGYNSDMAGEQRSPDPVLRRAATVDPGPLASVGVGTEPGKLATTAPAWRSRHIDTNN